MADRHPRRRTAIAALTLLPASPGTAQTAETMMARAREITAAPACHKDTIGDIIVCGRGDAPGRYRLPLPDERTVTPRPLSGGPAMADLFETPGDCGPSGTRRCTKREALSQGLGGGRDPLTLATRLADHLLDPE